MSAKNAIGRFVKYSLIFLTLLLSISAGSAAAQPDTSKQTELQTVEIGLSYCVKFNFENPNYIFKTRSALEAALSNYSNNIHDCLQRIKDLDLTGNILLGMDIYNGECHSFPLRHKVVKDEAAKLYRFQVTHPPLKSRCAGMTHHQLWVLVPKLPPGYDVAFEVSEKKPPEAQFGKEISIPAADGFPSLSRSCLQIDNMVYNEDSFKKLLSFAQCAKVLKADQFDLKKQTLIGWQTGGDCLMRVETKLYRDDEKKLFTFVVRNIWGGCRAGGWRQGMFAIDKIPSHYRVKFVEYLVQEYSDRIREASDSGDTWTADGQKVPVSPPASTPESEAAGSKALSDPPASAGGSTGGNATVMERVTQIETREIDLKGCLWQRLRSEAVFKDDDTFQKAIRKDGQEDFCRKDLEKIDFSKNTLLGINLNTGYCRTPVGLETKAFRDDAKKLYTLQISYIEPHGLCRALSSYDLWVLVPKMPEGYEAKFEVKAVESGKDQ